MMRVQWCLAILIICALGMGCAPTRVPMEGWEQIPLSQVFPATLMKYQDVRTLQAQLFVKLEVQDEFYLLQGVLLYENPAHLRLRLASSFGTTVGEVIYADGLLSLLVPSKGKIFQGWLDQEIRGDRDSIVLTMNFQDYHDTGTGQFPTTIYGVVEGMGVRFELRLKEPQVGLVLPAEAFSSGTEGWEVHSLKDLKDLLGIARRQEGS